MSYQVNTNGLIDTKDELVLVTAWIEEDLRLLQSKVQTYLDTNNGLGKEEFQQAMTKWNQGLSEMQNALNVGTGQLENIREAYEDVDRRGAQRFQVL